MTRELVEVRFLYLTSDLLETVPEKYTVGPQDEGADVTRLQCWTDGNIMIVRREFASGQMIDEWPAKLIRSKITKVFR